MANLNEILNDILHEGSAPVNSKKKETANEINKDAVHAAAARAAKTIFGNVDEKKLKRTIDAAIKKAEDTQDAIQIAINMMRG